MLKLQLGGVRFLLTIAVYYNERCIILVIVSLRLPIIKTAKLCLHSYIPLANGVMMNNSIHFRCKIESEYLYFVNILQCSKIKTSSNMRHWSQSFPFVCVRIILFDPVYLRSSKNASSTCNEPIIPSNTADF